MKYRSILSKRLFGLFLVIILTACAKNDDQLQVEDNDVGVHLTPDTQPSIMPNVSSTAPEVPTPGYAEVDQAQLPESIPLANSAQLEQMSAFLNNLEAEGQFMGSVLVAQDGAILLNEGYGMADIEAGIPNSPDNQYRIGSLTKQFTAAAILKLQEDGLLNVQDPVQKYIPDYPNGDRITIHHLLTHTSGIPNYEQRRDLPQVVQTPITLDALIASFSGQQLDFPPGQRYSYSSSGYVVLTKIIEIVSGQTYADYIQEQLFTPANMVDSGYDYLDSKLRNPATGYMLTGRGAQRAILTDSSWPTGAGALYSTLGDLYRWDRALKGNDILSESSKEAMYTPWVDTGQGAAYGYGWDVGSTLGHTSLVHGGGIFGFASYMARFPQDDAVIIVLSNGIQMPPRVVAEQLTQLLFNSRGN